MKPKHKIFLSCSPYVEFCLARAQHPPLCGLAVPNVRSPLPLCCASKYRRRIHWKCFAPIMRLFALIDPRRETYSRLDPISLLRVKRHIDFRTFCIQPTWQIGIAEHSSNQRSNQSADSHRCTRWHLRKHVQTLQMCQKFIYIHWLHLSGKNIFPFTNCHKQLLTVLPLKGQFTQSRNFTILLFTPISMGGCGDIL